jgi:hypothetical protein
MAYDWDTEVRPASSNNPIDAKYGWRKCAPWNHKGRRYHSSTGRVEVNVSYGSSGTRYIYENGSFWPGASPPAVPAFPSSLINEAEIKALNKLKDQKINLGQFLAEFDQTEQMIARHVLSIARSIKKWRKGNPASAWRAARKYEGFNASAAARRKIPKSWLELQYGWKPLLQDIYGAIQLLGAPDRDPYFHVKGYAEDETTVTKSMNSAFSNASYCQLQWRVKRKCWVSLYYLLTSPGLAEQSSLGLLNPAEIVWECLPYSFVVDWVSPIGSWLSSLTADAGYTFKGGSRSMKSEMGSSSLYSITMEHRSGVPSVMASGSSPSVNGVADEFSRVCYLKSPVPGVYVKNPLSALHVANAIALLIEAFRH